MHEKVARDMLDGARNAAAAAAVAVAAVAAVAASAQPAGFGGAAGAREATDPSVYVNDPTAQVSGLWLSGGKRGHQ